MLDVMKIDPGFRRIHAHAFRQSACAAEFGNLDGLRFLAMVDQEANVAIIKSAGVKKGHTFLFLRDFRSRDFNRMYSIEKCAVGLSDFPPFDVQVSQVGLRLPA